MKIIKTALFCFHRTGWAHTEQLLNIELMNDTFDSHLPRPQASIENSMPPLRITIETLFTYEVQFIRVT